MRSFGLFAFTTLAAASLAGYSCGKTPNDGSALTVTNATVSSTGGTGGTGGIGGTAPTSSAGGAGDGGSGGATGAGGSGGSGGSGGAPGPVCEQGQELCGGVCVNLKDDTANCGACGIPCNMAPNVVCNSGTCGPDLTEVVIHGCTSKKAIDFTGASTTITFTSAQITNPATYPLCLKITQTAEIAVQGIPNVAGGPLLLGGLVDADGIKNYDKTSPIQPTCYNPNAATPFDPNLPTTCYSGGTWPSQQTVPKSVWKVSVYPFYNNSKFLEQQGVIYVVK